MFPGYKRNRTTHNDLLDAVSGAMWVRPEQRLGQIIANIIHAQSANLFSIHDEDLIELLRDYYQNEFDKAPRDENDRG